MNIAIPVPMQPVKSSQIVSVGYDNAAQILYVLFTSQIPYRYLAVPPHIHLDFLGAASLGVYFRQCIKGRFVCEKPNAVGEWVAIGAFLASNASKDLLRKLAKRAEIVAGVPEERMGIMWRHALVAAGLGADIPDAQVDAWMDTLSQQQCTDLIEYLKGRT